MLVYVVRGEGKNQASVTLLKASDWKKTQVFSRIRKELRCKVLRDRLLRGLMEVDRLTINGIVVWEPKEHVSRSVARKRKKH